MTDDSLYPSHADRRDEAGACSPSDRRLHEGCAACATKTLRPYRAVKRYRGDRQVGRVSWENWCELWRLQPGDVSWPNGRDG